MERIEFTANQRFTERHRIFVQGRELQLRNHVGAELAAAVRYRRTALQPSLHPGISPTMPLRVTITDRARRVSEQFVLEPDQRRFEPTNDLVEPSRHTQCRPLRPLRPELLTCDLRLS